MGDLLFWSLSGGGRQVAEVSSEQKEAADAVASRNGQPSMSDSRCRSKAGRKPGIGEEGSASNHKSRLRKAAISAPERKGSDSPNVGKGSWVEVPVREVAAIASSPVRAAAHQSSGDPFACDSSETSPEGEVRDFEIKKKPMGEPTRKGHVQQVVCAFEAGMSLEPSQHSSP
ncbi:unnamed protein product [Linum trigynum]|uniref:Uncharacterized protein n=1 Tax=Linum trigynum TaxID=586398 RepID=A0AAV2CJF7_9ROSI